MIRISEDKKDWVIGQVSKDIYQKNAPYSWSYRKKMEDRSKAFLNKYRAEVEKVVNKAEQLIAGGATHLRMEVECQNYWIVVIQDKYSNISNLLGSILIYRKTSNHHLNTNLEAAYSFYYI
jgi:hypothetical protein